MFEVLWALLITTIYGIASVTLGARLLRVILPRWDIAAPEHIAAAFGTAFLLGQGVLANVWLLIGLAGRFYVPVVAAIIAAALLIGIRPAWPLLRGMVGKLRNGVASLQREPLIWRLLAAGVAFLIFETFLRALWGYVFGDALAFYMALPRLMAATHRLVIVPTDIAFVPLNQAGLHGEMHFAALHLFGLFTHAKLAGFLAGLSIATLLLAIGRRAGLGRRGQWITLLLLFTSTTFLTGAGNGKVDVFAAAMAVGAFYWALASGDVRAGERWRVLLLIGVFSGLAVIAKFSYIIILAPAMLVLVIWGYALTGGQPRWSRAEALHLLRELLWIGLWAALPFLPHMLKNGVLFGNPFLLVDGSDLDWIAPEITRYIGAAYPFVQAFGVYPRQIGNISALWLAFAPLALWLPRPSSWAQSRLLRLSAAAITGLGVGLLLFPHVFGARPRYALGVLVIMLLFAAQAAAHFLTREKHRVIHAAAWIAVAVMIALAGNSIAEVWRYSLNEVRCMAQGCEFLGDMWVATNYAPSMQINEDTAPGDRVYLATYHPYWLRPDLMGCIQQAEEQITVEEMLDTPAARWEYLYAHGFRYISFDRLMQADDLELLDPNAAPNWLELTSIFDSDLALVYRLDSTEPDRFATDAYCEEIQPDLWQVITPTETDE